MSQWLSHTEEGVWGDDDSSLSFTSLSVLIQ